MIIPIIGRSATEFWLGPGAAIYSGNSSNFKQSLISLPTNFNYQLTAALAQDLVQKLKLNLPLETFSFSHSNHRIGKCCHVFTRYKAFSDNSFVHFKVSDYDIAVARPELCFIQAAKDLDIAHLAFLGMRLAAMYYVQPEINAELKFKGGDGQTRKDRIPVTNVAQIKKYLENANGEYGIKKARKTVKFLIDNSNSPMESALATMMILPVELGGYGMPEFTMNEPILLSDSAANYFQYDVLRVDFNWSKSKVAAEYNSIAYHANQDQLVRDTNRINALQYSGIRVIPITYNNVKYFNNMEKQMCIIMDALGCPELKDRLKENKLLRSQLCTELLGTMPYNDFQNFI